MRGLKHKTITLNGVRQHGRIFYRCVDWNFSAGGTNKFSTVASFTDAWIETCFGLEMESRWKSHLLQMRGLKPNFVMLLEVDPRSHLLQMRGLKQWPSAICRKRTMSHLLQMRGLKHVGNVLALQCRVCRIFYRCVDWNRCFGKSNEAGSWSHLLQMRGLKPSWRKR